MSDKLVPFSSRGEVEQFRETFLVPANWKSCGVVVHISGAAGVGDSRPVALAVTEDAISLCDRIGPKVSIPILSIKEVKVIDLEGITFSINTPSGIVDMAPPNAKGISITYVLNPLGTKMEMSLYTFTPKFAFEWVNIVLEAIYRKTKGLGDEGTIFRR